ncbi:Ig-like domain-containing protein [Pirellulales bacterium]|nr:Ig-like domain-containing protein [Pirellulales bacterium]
MVSVSFDVPDFDRRWGSFVAGGTTTVTPAPVTIDPPPFVFQAEAVFDVTDFQGRLTVIGGDTYEVNGDGNDLAGDELIVHNQQSGATTTALTSATLTDGEVVYGIDGLIDIGAATTDHPLGVQYEQLERIEIRFGDQADGLTINATPEGMETDLLLAGGNDIVQLNELHNDTHILGGAGDDRVETTQEIVSKAPLDTEFSFDGDGHRREDIRRRLVSELSAEQLVDLQGSPWVYINTAPDSSYNPNARSWPDQFGISESDLPGVGGNEVQRIATNADGGTFKLSLGASTTDAIDYDATHAELISAIETLGAGSVSISGSGGLDDPWLVEFLSGSNVDLLAGDFSALMLADGKDPASLDASISIVHDVATGASLLYATEERARLVYQVSPTDGPFTVHLPGGVTEVRQNTSGEDEVWVYAAVIDENGQLISDYVQERGVQATDSGSPLYLLELSNGTIGTTTNPELAKTARLPHSANKSDIVPQFFALRAYDGTYVEQFDFFDIDTPIPLLQSGSTTLGNAETFGFVPIDGSQVAIRSEGNFRHVGVFPSVGEVLVDGNLNGASPITLVSLGAGEVALMSQGRYLSVRSDGRIEATATTLTNEAIFQFVELPPFATNELDASEFSLNGDAAFVNGRLRVTPSSSAAVGSAWVTRPLNHETHYSFSTSMEIDVYNANPSNRGGDGMAFVIQSGGLNILGSDQAGGDLGLPISGSVPFVAVEFDNVVNGSAQGDQNATGPHVGIDTNSQWGVAIGEVARYNRDSIGQDPRYVWIDYDGEVDILEVYFSATNEKPAQATVHANVDLDAIFGADHTSLTVGWTAATGSFSNVHEVVAWQFQAGYGEPLPAFESVNNPEVFAGDLLWLDEAGNRVSYQPTVGHGVDANGDPIILYVPQPSLIQTPRLVPTPLEYSVMVDNPDTSGGVDQLIISGGNNTSGNLSGVLTDSSLGLGEVDDSGAAVSGFFGESVGVEVLDVTLGGGDDTFDATAYSGDLTLTGGAGNDTLVGGSGNDLIDGGTGDDMLVGGPGSDNLLGGAGNDIIIGGSMVAGTPDGDDVIDAGAGDDAVAGDNAQITASPDSLSPRFRATADGTTLGYDSNGNPLLAAETYADPAGSPNFDITLLDHSDATDAALYGNDTIEAGSGDDQIFGQLGDDDLYGDHSGQPAIPLLDYDARGDVDGDQIWSNLTGIAGFDWALDSSVQWSLEGGQPTFQFDGSGGGSSSSIDAVSGNPTSRSAFIELSFKPSDLLGQEVLFETGGNAIGASFVLDDDQLIMTVKDGSNTRQISTTLESATLESANESIHVFGGIDVAASSAADGLIVLYVNGNKVGQETFTGLLDWSGTDTAGLGKSAGGSIGGDDGTLTGFGRFSGEINLLRIYDQFLDNLPLVGDDYVEGGGGNDLIVGGLGQDDLIGGSSSLFGLTDSSSRTDGSDTIYGGFEETAALNDLGNLYIDGHAEDADTIVGDNANIYRLVNSETGQFLAYNYDNYGSEAMLVRAVELLNDMIDESVATVGSGNIDTVTTDHAGNQIVVDTIQPFTVTAGTYSAAQFNYEFKSFTETPTGSVTPLLLTFDGTDYTVVAIGDAIAYAGDTGEFVSSSFGGSNTFSLSADAIVYAGFAWTGTLGIGYAGSTNPAATFSYHGGFTTPNIGQPISGNSPETLGRVYDFSVDLVRVVNVGGSDIVYAGAGDDQVFGMVGNDELYGEGQDDDLIGGTGADNIFGGAGEDGIAGDNGRFATSRNGLAEPLAGLLAPRGEVSLMVSGYNTGAVEYIAGRLQKDFVAEPTLLGGADLIFGGLGDDFIHGGEGNDALSGAEANLGQFGVFDGSQDIGDVAANGSASYAGGVYTINGSGTDIWNSSDEFHFLSVPRTGDTEIVARVGSVTDTNVWAKAGLMFRNGTDADAQYGFLLVRPDRQISFQWRDAPGISAQMDSSLFGGTELPKWLKLRRTGNALTSFYSTDGANWIMIGTRTMSLADTLEVGLAVTSHNDGVVAQAIFDHLHLDPVDYDQASERLVAFDPDDPLAKIDGFLLNFESIDGSGNTIEDGKDRIFGDDGNDWIVGGTGDDRLFGGLGNDLLNGDDNLDTNNGANNTLENLGQAHGDFVFGGGGQDILIANTGNDRLIDWRGDFDAFVAPFETSSAMVIRDYDTDVAQFLLDLGRTSGADQSLTEPAGELGLVTPADGTLWDDQAGPAFTINNSPTLQPVLSGGIEDDRGVAPTDAGSTPGDVVFFTESGIATNADFYAATIWFDTDNDGVLDPGEPRTTTNIEGQFELIIPEHLDRSTGVLRMQGGYDVTTGEAAVATLTGLTLEHTNITPLTSLVHYLVDGGKSVEQAEQLVRLNFGIHNTIELGDFDHFEAARADDPHAPPVLLTVTSLHSTVVQTYHLFAGLTGADLTSSEISSAFSDSIFRSMAEYLESNGSLGLRSLHDLESVLNLAASKLVAAAADRGIQLTLDTAAAATISRRVAEVIAAGNTQILLLADGVGSPHELVTVIDQVKALAHGQRADDLLLVGSGELTIEEAVARHAALDTASFDAIRAVLLPPHKSHVPDFVLLEDESLTDFVFTVFDFETSLSQLTITTSSDNPGLLPEENISITAGSAAERRLLSLTPAADRSGVATVVLTITDEQGHTLEQDFTVTVFPVNDAPTFTLGPGSISSTETSHVTRDWAGGITAGTPQEDESEQFLAFQLTLSEADQVLFLVQPAIDAQTGQLTYTPDPARHGTATVTVQLTDGGSTDHDGVNRSALGIFTITSEPVLEIDSIVVNDGAAQRSNIETVSIQFNQTTNLQSLIDDGSIAGAVEVVPAVGNKAPLTADRFQWHAETHTLELDLTIDGFGGSSETMLADGNHKLQVETSSVFDLLSRALQDTDGAVDGVYRFGFHRLEGDFNGSKQVELESRDAWFSDVEFGARAGSPGYDAAFDFDGDDIVSSRDYYYWLRNLVGNSLPVEVEAIVLNDGDAQPTNIETLNITFNQATNLPSLIEDGSVTGVVELYDTTSGETQIALNANQFLWIAETNTLRIDLSVDGFGGSSETLLFEGDYQLRLQTNQILNANDQPLLDADDENDGIYRFDFERLGSLAAQGSVAALASRDNILSRWDFDAFDAFDDDELAGMRE